jgi:hypothetical protein
MEDMRLVPICAQLFNSFFENLKSTLDIIAQNSPELFNLNKLHLLK